VSTKPVMDTSVHRRTNKRWPEALKREIVAATLVSGASVSVVARQYDVNANQVFAWRHRYRSVPEVAPPPPPPRLLEVRVEPASAGPSPEPMANAANETIEIEVAGTQNHTRLSNLKDKVFGMCHQTGAAFKFRRCWTALVTSFLFLPDALRPPPLRCRR
jgi:transposase